MISVRNKNQKHFILAKIANNHKIESRSYGLLTECLWFFHAIFAKCSGFVPANNQMALQQPQQIQTSLS